MTDAVITRLGLIRHIARDHQMAVVMTMHDLNAALQDADLYLCLKDGRILGSGPITGITPDLIGKVCGVDMVYHNGLPVVVPRSGMSPAESAA